MRAIAIVALLLPLPVIACQLILGIEHDLTVIDAGAIGSSDASVQRGRCSHGIAPPTPPDAANGPDGPPLVFALNFSNFSGRTDAGALAGYDLDGVCTCDPRDDSVNDGGPSCKTDAGPGGSDCDEDGGVDNASERLASILGFFIPLKGDIEQRNACGRQTLLILLSGYNGAADDPEVFVAVISSFGILDSHDTGGEIDASQCIVETPPTFQAKHDGTDKWSVRSSDKTPTLFTGYVTQHQLVLDGRTRANVSFDTFVLSNVLSLSTPILTAKLVQTDAGLFRLGEGIIAGRAEANDLLTSAAALRAPNTDGSLLCDTALFATAQQTICSTVDMVTPLSRDFRGDRCNAISVVLQFEAEQALLGRVHDPDSGLFGCAATFPQCP